MIFGLRTRPGTAHKPIDVTPAAFDSRSGRRGKFVGLLIFAVVWNGFVAFMAFMGAGWCMVPFALIGVAVAVGAVVTGIAIFNPVVSFAFDKTPLRVGEKITGEFKIDVNYLNIKDLKFFLEGRENVTYRQGTDTRTETHVAYHLPIFDTVRNIDMERGKLAFTLPTDAMTSFRGRNNTFTWHLCVRGEIPHRPNIKDDFNVTVVPATWREA